jgi:hypothetical protein
MRPSYRGSSNGPLPCHRTPPQGPGAWLHHPHHDDDDDDDDGGGDTPL